MGNKLFKELLSGLGEYDSSMSMLDVLDRLEKLKLIHSAERWLDYRNLRNILTHEYPDNRDDIIDGIRVALTAFGEIKLLLQELRTYIENKNLIKAVKYHD